MRTPIFSFLQKIEKIAVFRRNFNVPLREYTLTDLADIADLPTTTSDAKGKFKGDISFSQRPPLGSICQVITATELRIFMLGENGWVEI